MDATLDTDAGGQPSFLATLWRLVAVASSESSAEARTGARGTLSPLFLSGVRVSSAAQEMGARTLDLMQNIFMDLLKKSTLIWADPHRRKFRSYLLAALNYCLAHAAETLKRGVGRQWQFLNVAAVEHRSKLPAHAEMTTGKVFERRWAADILKQPLCGCKGSRIQRRRDSFLPTSRLTVGLKLQSELRRPK
jgi:hypothetical protein